MWKLLVMHNGKDERKQKAAQIPDKRHKHNHRVAHKDAREVHKDKREVHNKSARDAL